LFRWRYWGRRGWEFGWWKYTDTDTDLDADGYFDLNT